jgi:AraC family transcriptional regulator
MQHDNSGVRDAIRPLEWRKVVPFEAAAASDRLGWVGLEAVRYCAAPASELNPPAMTHHRLILFARPPEELDLMYEGVNRRVPPPAGSIAVVPAGSPARYRWSGSMDTLNVYLQPALVARVAEEAFQLDATRLTVPPLGGVDLPHLRSAMGAVDAELMADGAGGPLAAESLANLLAVHLIRYVLAPRRAQSGRVGRLPRGKLRAVVEYIEEHLDASPTLEQLAAVVQLSPFHFARQFKVATGLPPHQYVIARRVERARQLLEAETDLTLAEIAAYAGFSDQSQFSLHFKRLIGVTPGQFRAPARIA